MWGSVSKHFLKEVVCLPNLKPFPRLMAYGVAIMECLCPIPPYPIRLPPILSTGSFPRVIRKLATHERELGGIEERNDPLFPLPLVERWRPVERSLPHPAFLDAYWVPPLK